MTDSDVGSSVPTLVTIRLDSVQVRELRRWATVGGRSLEDTVLAAVDEYITPVTTGTHGTPPEFVDAEPERSDPRVLTPAPAPKGPPHLRLLSD
ncbi:hypothetical protein [Cryptosporangium arvum]|uniref:hypothetical protein n=1 Tax=Cryptosporangium arvum TaxID=80871 RepID=UPI0012EE5BE8|nr:hypothetical protein [Cryptosporangium arvum]